MISSIFVSVAAHVNIREAIAFEFGILTETRVRILKEVIVCLNWLHCLPELWMLYQLSKKIETDSSAN